MKPATRLIFWMIALFAAGCIAPARTLLVGTPDDVIRQRAAGAPAPRWQIPLGTALVEDMQLLGPERLLVGLKKDFPGLPNLDYFLVDTASGNVIWRLQRGGDSGLYSIVLALKDLLLFRIERGRTTSLLALDPRSGAERWRLQGQGAGAIYAPVLAGSRMVVVNPHEKGIQLKACGLLDGVVLWEKNQPAVMNSTRPAVFVNEEDILLFSPGFIRLSSVDGRRISELPSLAIDDTCPPPQYDGSDLWVVDSSNRMHRLDPEKGHIRWTIDLPGDVRYTNVYPLGANVYLRAIGKSGEARLQSMLADKGSVNWTYTGREQSVSNLIESDGRLFFATPTSLVAVDTKNGRQLFSNPITTTGRAYPVRIRQIKNRIIYIGELIVAACDARSGALVYSHGMTPLCPECHLNGLDAAVPRLKEALREISGQPAGNQGELSRLATSEMVRYQNLANTYSSQARSAAGRGDYIGSDLASMKASFAQHNAKMQANAAFAYAIMDLGLALRQAFQAAAIKTSIERQECFRSSILKSCSLAENEEYAYRPHLEWVAAGDSFTTLSVVHLPTGQRRDTYLSPEYLSYGLWNLVDFDKGVVYHHGIGLNPALYEMSEARRMYPYDSARTINTFLIAMPVEIPR